MELKIDRGLKSYEVTDADGTPLGTIYINPADVGIVARLEEAGNACLLYTSPSPRDS